MSTTTALSSNEGFIKNGKLLVGAHICLKVANQVGTDALPTSCIVSMSTLMYGPRLAASLDLYVQAEPMAGSNDDLLHSALYSGVKSLHSEQQLCDVTIKAGDKELRAHRIVLAAHSDYFRAMFQARTGYTCKMTATT